MIEVHYTCRDNHRERERERERRHYANTHTHTHTHVHTHTHTHTHKHTHTHTHTHTQTEYPDWGQRSPGEVILHWWTFMEQYLNVTVNRRHTLSQGLSFLSVMFGLISRWYVPTYVQFTHSTHNIVFIAKAYWYVCIKEMKNLPGPVKSTSGSEEKHVPMM